MRVAPTRNVTPYGDPCRAVLTGSLGETRLDLEVTRATPWTCGVLVIGHDRADRPLCRSVCRLLVDYRTCVAIRIDGTGRGVRSLALVDLRGTTIDLQYVGWSRATGGYESSNGLEVTRGQ